MHWLFPTIQKKKPESLRKLCEEPDCMFSENCVVWTATWVLTPINVVSSPLPSFLLYFLFFATSFRKRFSLCHSSNVYFSQCRKHLWKNGNTICSFCCEKGNSLFVLSTVETSSLDSHFLLIFQKQNKFLFAIFPKCCKHKLCLNVLLRNFFSPKEIWQNKVFSFRKNLPFLFFYSLPLMNSIVANKYL